TTAYLPRDLIASATEATAREAASDNSQPQADAAATAPLVSLPEEGIPLDEVEMSLVRQALERSGGNQTRAAELLGISRGQLCYRLKKLEVTTTNQ
ncbi:MAG TPA: helix-turn-helix domain-containing protein, partial [Blastocatellia bacterium]|nr:helix-turn-helix domain-containing protein [Blastocatellia bacterium]